MRKFDGSDVPFKAYITPIDNQETAGEWVSFPTTAEEIRDVFARLNIGPSSWQISNYQSYVTGIDYLIRDCNNLDELNFLAVKLDELSDDDITFFNAVTEIGRHNDTLADAINLCDNLECYNIYPDIENDEDLGRYWMYHEANFDRDTLDELEDYINFESYGENVRYNEDGEFAASCFVVRTNTGFTDYYSGDIEDIREDAIITNLIAVPPLDENARLEKAAELAESLDSFFRAFDVEYAFMFPKEQVQQNALCEELYNGKIARIEKFLADLGQTDHDVLMAELAEYKAGIGYDPALDMPPEKMRVLVVEPGKEPYMKEIDDATEAMQQEVNGRITATYPFDDPVGIVYNDDAKQEGLEFNRALFDSSGRPYDVVAGTFLVVGLGEEKFVSLPEDMATKYAERFASVEIFARVNEKIVMIQVPPEAVAGLDGTALDNIISQRLGDKKPSIHDRLKEAKKDVQSKTDIPKVSGRNEQEL